MTGRGAIEHVRRSAIVMVSGGPVRSIAPERRPLSCL